MSEYWDRFMRERLTRRRMLKGGALAGVGLLAGSTFGCESSQPKPAASTASSTPSTSSTPIPASPTPAARKPQGKITVSGGPPKGEVIDPHRAQHSIVFWRWWTDDLVMPDKNGPTDNGLAISWSMTPDGLSWTFKLHKGVLFHDETEMTAEDVKFSFERQLKFQKSPAAGILAGFFDHTEIVDPYTIKVVLKKPEMALPVHLQTIARILPKKYIEKVGDDYFLEHPVGTGPWKVTKLEPGIMLEMEAFEKHYNRVPHVKSLSGITVPDVSTNIAMLQAGELDIMYNLPYELLDTLKAMPGMQVLINSNDQVREARFVTGGAGKVWLDERVRKAFMYGFNREKMANAFYKGLATHATQPALPLTFGFNPDLKPWPFDPNKARQLMAEAGYPNGIDVAIYPAGASGQRFDEAQAVATLLPEVGLFRPKLVPLEGAAWLAGLFNRSLPAEPAGIWWCAAYFGYAWAGDAGYVARTFHSSKGTYTYPMGDQKLDDMIDAQATITDVEKRRKALQEMLAYMYEKQLFLTGCILPFLAVIGPRIKSWKPLNASHLLYENVELKS